MVKRLTRGCTAVVQKLLPDAFIFSMLLTAIVFVLAIPLTHQSPFAMIIHWGKGFWNLLGFFHADGVGYTTRSEERRVGKECRSRWSPYH